MSDDNNRRWHLGREVPLATILSFAGFLLIQTITIVWWASRLDHRVDALERNVIATAPQADRLTRVEVKIENVQSGVDEIKRLIRREPQ